MKKFTFLLLGLLVLSIPAFAVDKGTSYREFTTLDEAEELAKEGPVVLYFNATWCPTCKVADAEFKNNSNKLGDIVVLKVDYDSSKKLQKKYGVTYQHTFVQIDENGKKLVSWSGGDLNNLVEKVRR